MTFGDDRLPPRFWAKVKVDADGHWIWTASVTSDGYGKFADGSGANTWSKAHRVSYRALVGPIAPGLHVDHLCRITRCVNPAHLEPVTPKENARRNPNWNGNKTHCPSGHEYNKANTRIASDGRRYCRVCKRSKARAAYSAKRQVHLRPGGHT